MTRSSRLLRTALIAALLLVIPAGPAAVPTLAAGSTQTYTSVADFSTACGTDPTFTSTAVSDENGGELGLAPALADYFSAPPLDTTTRWSTGNYGGVPTIAVSGGALSITSTPTGGGYVASQTSFTSGVVEGVVTFSAGVSQHFGFFQAPNFDRYAMFSTAGTTDKIYARTKDSTPEQPTEIVGATVGTPLRLRIEWTSDGTTDTVKYFLAGAQVATHTFATVNAQPMSVGISNDTKAALALSADWIRVTPYSALTGSYRTCPFSVSGTAPQSWGNFRWSEDVPGGTTLTVQARTSDDGISWSSYSAALTNGSTPSSLPDSRYIQLLVGFTTTNALVTPRLLDLSFDYAPVPTLSITDATLAEGNSGTQNMVFTVSLSNAANHPVTANYATADGTASAGSDYTATSGTITIPANATSTTISVPILGDTIVEPNETFTVNLSNPTRATILDGQGLGTITNDDSTALSIADASVAEGDSGTTALVFTVTLSNPSATPVTVNYATANGTATAGSDYTATSGTLTFPALSTSQTISVNVNGDTVVEPNETFTVNLTNPVGATIARAQATGTITNDDGAIINIADASTTEGNSGTKTLAFTVSLTRSSATPVTVNYATANGTATAGSDYTAASGTLTFPAFTTSQVISVTVRGDLVVEPDETFTVTLSNPSGATINRAQATGIIQNDDSTALSIQDASITEGNSGTKVLSFTVTLSNPSASIVTVRYATADGTATAGSDYTAASGTLTFPALSTSQPIQIVISGDTVVEPDETFTVTLSNPVGATIARAQATGTILNDEQQFRVFMPLIYREQ